jgi:hypothetical protein
MNERQDIFDKINELLQNSDLGFEINDTSDLEEFLDNEENHQYEEYEEIESLYAELVELNDDDGSNV